MGGQTADSSDYYVNGGVNWAAFSLAELVAMVSDQASVPQLVRLAQDWRETGDGVVAAADELGEALDDLMYYWTGASAEKARHAVALNAQWVADLGTTAHQMGDPIEEAAGALKAAQEAMPPLPATPASPFPGAAPHGAAETGALTQSSLGAAVGATAESADGGFAAQAEQEELKRVAVETMQRFEAAALGIDRTIPRFLGQDTVLRPDPDDSVVDEGPERDLGGGSSWVKKVTQTAGVDQRWQVLTGMGDQATGAAAQPVGAGSGGDGVGGRGFGAVSGGVGGGMLAAGPGAGAGPGPGGGGVRPGIGLPGRVAPAGPGAVPAGASGGAAAPIGGAPMGAGLGTGSDAQQHRRRFPFDAEDPFDPGQKASPPVIGL
ncbi:PPE domain-containing protein [Actinophytocola xanthii]|uniref:PPE domain-containing protein n=1 Tax=Actinophytocola xanthii TaxID=1912961 RepID=A0A1Q8CMN3_9PSEU|nr:PPE domain-containing protein [Actinophytocola xanthii]OLF15617.1 hypothetical protein BU204_21120 [Actinophytocola xanthii]